MERGLIRRAVMLVAMIGGVATLAGCGEQLQGDAACPILCPQENLAVQQSTLLDAVALDTTIDGYPNIGLETRLLLANRGDTIDTRAAIRFDELPRNYRDANGAEVEIARVFNAMLVTKLASKPINPDSPVQIDVYDLDAPTSDTAASELLPFFRNDRRIGGGTVTLGTLADSVLRIPLSDSAVLDKVTTHSRLRVGIAVSGSNSVSFHIASFGTVGAPRLTFRVSDDTTVLCCEKAFVSPVSETPPDEPYISSLLHDFVIVARQPAPVLPPATLAVGGITGRRSYFRFKVPQELLDSRILRATLLLTQRPNPGTASPGDSLVLQVMVPGGRDPITELSRQVSLVIPLHQAEGNLAPSARDLLTVRPTEGRVHEIELGQLAAQWRQVLSDSSSRAIVLRLPGEGELGGEVFFHSSEAPEAVRPKLRITYVPRGGYGIP